MNIGHKKRMEAYKSSKNKRDYVGYIFRGIMTATTGVLATMLGAYNVSKGNLEPEMLHVALLLDIFLGIYAVNEFGKANSVMNKWMKELEEKKELSDVVSE